MKPKKKKKRQFRQAFARTLQHVGKRRNPQHRFQGPLREVAILARERYGDAIMLTPLIGCLRKRYPDVSITVIAFSKIIFDFFSADPNVNAVYNAKKYELRYFRNLLLKRFDLLFNTKDHPSTSFLMQTLLVRSRFKAGHINTYHEGLYDHLIDMDPNTHESLKNLAILELIDPDGPTPEIRPYLPQMPISDAIVRFVGSMEPNRIIGINISAGHQGGHRTPSQWTELISSFPEQTFVIFSSPGDIEEKREIEAPNANVVPSPSTGNIGEVSEIIKKLRLLISPDTSLVHIASCSDTPVIALFREKLADRCQFGPLSRRQMVIVSPTPDVADIDNETIADALRKMLETLP